MTPTANTIAPSQYLVMLRPFSLFIAAWTIIDAGRHDDPLPHCAKRAWLRQERQFGGRQEGDQGPSLLRPESEPRLLFGGDGGISGFHRQKRAEVGRGLLRAAA